MKRLLYFFLAALLFALPMTAAAQPSVHVVSGPYLQAVGEREFTVVWTTNIDAVSWVEIAPDDGTHFYNTERPKYYQVLNGRRPIGKLHVVTVSGLEPATTYRYRVMQNGVLVNEGRQARHLRRGLRQRHPAAQALRGDDARPARRARSPSRW